MRENTFADDSLDGDEDDLVSKRTELPNEPSIWELRTRSVARLPNVSLAKCSSSLEGRLSVLRS